MTQSDDAVRTFLTEKKREVDGRALMSYPSSSPTEQADLAAWAKLFQVLAGPILIRHPHAPLTLELSKVLGARVAYLISIGDYELGDLELLERYVQPGDRVMELGGGAGLTAAFSAKRSGERVVVVEPDRRLFEVIGRQVELNGGTVAFEHGAVLGPEAPPSIEFYLDEEVWFSSITPGVATHGERQREPVTVPVLQLGALLTKHRPTVLMCDIEGAEREAFVPALPHRPRNILIEIHAPIFGEQDAAGVVQRLVDHGYRFVDQKGWTYVFEDGRVLASPAILVRSTSGSAELSLRHRDPPLRSDDRT